MLLLGNHTKICIRNNNVQIPTVVMLRHVKKNLYHHIQFKHEKVRFECEFCETKTISKPSLDMHIGTEHGNTKYLCDQGMLDGHI